ncbi:succinate dehydrogenase [Rhodobacteraceae bacterium NNCM2]|nr:succinate dehydrogenase [Coraliihabitans acroporae]
MLGLRLYLAQRISAVVMAPLVLGHLALMIYAIQGGLSSQEILSRTQGSVSWMLFYGLFVVAAAVHAAIGLRVIVHETFRLRGAPLEVLTWGLFALFLSMGLHAVAAVTMT